MIATFSPPLVANAKVGKNIIEVWVIAIEDGTTHKFVCIDPDGKVRFYNADQLTFNYEEAEEDTSEGL